MKLTFMIVNIILLIIMINILKIVKKDNESYNLLGGLYRGSMFTSFAYLLFLLIPSEKVAPFMFSLYLSCTVWLITAFLEFVLCYAYGLPKKNKFRYPLWILCVADTVCCLLNAYNKNFLVVNLTPTINNELIRTTSHGALYRFHLVIMLIIFFVTFILFLIKIFKSKSIYRRKYTLIFVAYNFAVGCAFAHVILDMKLNISILAFIITAIVISYVSGNIVSKGLIKQFVNESFENVENICVLFDIDNKPVYINLEAKKTLKIEEVNDIKLTKLIDSLETKFRIFEKDAFQVLDEYKKRNYSISYKKLQDKKGIVIGACLVMHDITEQYKRMNAEREELMYDHLTRVYTRQAFAARAQNVLKNSTEKYCIMYSDIKNFKLINDYYGSEMGDKILVGFADELRRLFEKNKDVVYGRAANDNFLILLPEKVLKKLNFQKEIDKINKECGFRVFCYLGIYRITDKNMSIYNLVNNAIIALQEIKNSYRTFVNYYDESQKSNIVEEQRLVASFEEALKNREFKMFLQPQVSKENKLLGAEALVRWEKDGKMISPGAFIPTFEKAGIISSLDTYIWEEAAKKIKEWSDKGINDLSISVNISVDDLYSIDIKKTLVKIVNKYKIDSKRLKLEFTETAFANDASEIISLIDDLRNSGFIVEMDDFGSGYSSLTLLKDINADVVKLDMAFLYETEKIDKSRVIVSRLMNLLKELGVEVVCEGVENKNQFEYLTSIDCDVFQGYYIDKPISVAEFENKYMEEK